MSTTLPVAEGAVVAPDTDAGDQICKTLDAVVERLRTIIASGDPDLPALQESLDRASESALLAYIASRARDLLGEDVSPAAFVTALAICCDSDVKAPIAAIVDEMQSAITHWVEPLRPDVNGAALEDERLMTAVAAARKAATRTFHQHYPLDAFPHRDNEDLYTRVTQAHSLLALALGSCAAAQSERDLGTEISAETPAAQRRAFDEAVAALWSTLH